MAVYKAVPNAVADAVPTILSGNTAQVDKSATSAGWGLAEYGNGEKLAQPVPGAATNSPVASPDIEIPYARDELANRSRNGAVGHVPGPGEYGQFIPGRAFRGHGAPQGQGNTLQPVPGGVNGVWTDQTDLQTNDLHSQDTDNHGWFQLHANNRVAKYLRFGQSHPINNPTWMGYSENVGSFPLANPGVDYDTFDNTNVGGFQLADGTRNSNFMADGQNAVYENPGPPNTTTSASFSQGGYDPAEAYF